MNDSLGLEPARPPVPMAIEFDEAVLPYRMRATSHIPALMAAAAWLTWATNDEPPMLVPSR